MLVITVVSATSGGAQGVAPPVTPSTPPTPATKLEGFKPAAGTVVTFGYDEFGTVSGVSVDARELRDTRGGTVRGLLVEVTESQYRQERSFVDADEIGELIKGLDALLEVKSNPTSFKNFEVRYTTRGELQLTAFSSEKDVGYTVRAGRVTAARRFLSASDVQKFRTMLVAAQEKLVSMK